MGEVALQEYSVKPIARIYTDFTDKFGIPRQAGIVEELEGRIVFEPEYRNEDALRGIEDFSHIWLIWQFSQSVRQDWSPTVRPPRLGGNRRVGVFATRSPFRPNALGLSCVRLLSVEKTADEGCVLHVAGADILSGTPIYDIKPYIPYADCRTDATGGFAPDSGQTLRVSFAPGTVERLPEKKRLALEGVLANDPRPRYQNDPERVYGIDFAGFEIKFTVRDEALFVLSISDSVE